MKYNYKKEHEGKANLVLNRINSEKRKEKNFDKKLSDYFELAYRYLYKTEVSKSNIIYTSVVAFIFLLLSFSLYILSHKFILILIFFIVSESFITYIFLKEKKDYVKFKKLYDTTVENIHNLKK